MAENGISTVENPTVASNNQNYVPQADSISLETVVNMLVQKKICTVDELFMLEGRIRDKRIEEQQINYVTTKIKSESQRHSSSGHHWLKRRFSKYRWTRRLGARLFGWKWKKVKRSNQHDSSTNLD